MKKLGNKVLAFILIITMLVTTSVVSAFALSPVGAADDQFELDMTATKNAQDSSIIDVVITVKGIKQELYAVEFLLNYDAKLVEGVYQVNSNAEMDVFMTKTPMYTFSYGGTEMPAPRYEQICYYDAENSRYEMRFCDLLSYPFDKGGVEYKGLIEDGELVITVPFKVLDSSAAEFEFTATDVKGTTKVGLNSVDGTGDTAVYSTKTQPSEPPVVDPNGKYFSLDMTTAVNKEDSSIIDVVITIKDIKEELVAIEFLLNFDDALVEGVYKENLNAEMDVFMTTVPTYILKQGNIEIPVPRYEQICYYDAENSRYEGRFCDLLSYPFDKGGVDYKGLINDGELVVTIPFKVLDGASGDAEFSLTDVKGTTENGLNSVFGNGDTAVYTISTKNTYPLGDVNRDGRVDILDATAVQRYVALMQDLDDEQMELADVNRDGDVSILDATQIQRFVAQFITEF